MKYTIESTENGCIETIEMKDGHKYIKQHIRTPFGSKCKDFEFAEQMEVDGFCEEILDGVYDAFDGFLASSFMDIAELEEGEFNEA